MKVSLAAADIKKNTFAPGIIISRDEGVFQLLVTDRVDRFERIRV